MLMNKDYVNEVKDHINGQNLMLNKKMSMNKRCC